MLPSQEHLLVPFEVRLLGRLVADPDRPFDDFIDMVDVGIDVYSWHFTTRVIGPIQETISRRGSSSQSNNSTRECVTVTAKGSAMYTLPGNWPWLNPECLVEGFQKAALQLGGSFYVVTSLRTASGYSVTSAPAAGYSLGKQSTELDSSRVTPLSTEALSADLMLDEIVVDILFLGITVDYGEGISSTAPIATSFLDWRRGPSQPPANGPPCHPSVTTEEWIIARQRGAGRF